VVFDHLDQKLAEPGLSVDDVHLTLRRDVHHQEREVDPVVTWNRVESRVCGQMALFSELGQFLAGASCERYAAVGDVVSHWQRELVKHIDWNEAAMAGAAKPLDTYGALHLDNLFLEGRETAIVIHFPVDYERKLSGLEPLVN
jgi:hypothetical protein